MGVENLHRGDSYFPSPTTNIREWSCVIALADYFIGCDSVGQHFAKVFDKKASVFMGGGTHEKNVSYPDEFHIIKKDTELYPIPMRISGTQNHLALRMNENRMIYSDEEIQFTLDVIRHNIES